MSELTVIYNPGIWYTCDRVRCVHNRASKPFQDQYLKLQVGIYIVLVGGGGGGGHVEAHLLKNKLLGKCKFFDIIWKLKLRPSAYT